MITKFSKMLMVAALTASFVSCDKNDDDDDVTPPVVNTTISGTLNANRTLTADKTWTLKGYVYVPNGVTLTIEPGTTIVSDVVEKGALCVERGGKLIANGTPSQPIVFTSGKAAGQRAPGDWGGIVLLGFAPTNRTSTPVIEGGLDRPYGGNNAADNSGSLKYVRIEYAGIAAFANSEINALTLGGVGTGTVLEHIQTVYGNDDAYEFFGGTVDAKHLVAYGTADDDLDFDFGYRGRIQFAAIIRDPLFIDEGDAGNGVESDNDGSGTTASPFTHPMLSNITWIGANNAPNTRPNHNFGNRWRRATRFDVHNSIMLGWMRGGLVLESDATVQGYMDGTSKFMNNIVHAMMDPFRSTSSLMNNAAVETKALAEGNIRLNSPDGVLTAPFSITAPNLIPAAGSAALTGASFTNLTGSFWTPTTYRGAFGTTNWMQGWTRFPVRGM